MDYWTQIAAYPSLVIGPVSVAALISAGVSIWLGRRSRLATSDDVDRKIAAERQITDDKFAHERDEAMSERAWADYGLRRDIYLDLAAQIGCLFESGSTAGSTTTAERKTTFHETTRKARLIGSDDVVMAINAFSESIKASEPPDVTSRNYGRLMNAIRQDIRTLNTTPPVGTALDESAFPIES